MQLTAKQRSSFDNDTVNIKRFYVMEWKDSSA